MNSTHEHTCPECGEPFDGRHALAGHIGSAHRRKLLPIEHGSEKGYIYHIRRGVPFPEDEGDDPCGCREAHNEFHKLRRRSRASTLRLRRRHHTRHVYVRR